MQPITVGVVLILYAFVRAYYFGVSAPRAFALLMALTLVMIYWGVFIVVFP